MTLLKHIDYHLKKEVMSITSRTVENDMVVSKTTVGLRVGLNLSDSLQARVGISTTQVAISFAFTSDQLRLRKKNI
jgi:hypothetical protein